MRRDLKCHKLIKIVDFNDIVLKLNVNILETCDNTDKTRIMRLILGEVLLDS